VAMLDDVVVTASLEVADAELRALEAELSRTRALAQSGGSREQLASRDDARRFEIDAEDRRLEALSLSVAIETDRVEEQRLALKMQRLRPLNQSGIVSADEYDDIRLQHDRVGKRIAENKAALATTQEKLSAAENRKQQYLASAAGMEEQLGSDLSILEARIEAQTHRVTAARARREALVLRAPVSGRVQAVLAQAGQSIVAGEAVAVITPRFTDEIVAYVPEQDRRLIDENAPVEVLLGGWPPRSTPSRVLRVSPAIEPLPRRLWRSPNAPEYGMPFVVNVAKPLMPGERVRVRLQRHS